MIYIIIRIISVSVPERGRFSVDIIRAVFGSFFVFLLIVFVLFLLFFLRIGEGIIVLCILLISVLLPACVYACIIYSTSYVYHVQAVLACNSHVRVRVNCRAVQPSHT